jgi:SAM-dependent methyltransferase
MSQRMTPEQRGEVDRALDGTEGAALIDLMSRLSAREQVDGASPRAVATAERLGWIDEHRSLTASGLLAADPLREYAWWERRGRVITYNDRTAVLGPALFQGKRVVEIGCGFGVNLLTLQQQAAFAYGIEIQPYYLDFTAPLARHAGVPRPTILIGDASRIPLRDGSADVVIALGAFHLMPLRETLAAAARLLVPGGLVVLVNSVLSGHLRNLRDQLPSLVRRPKSLARQALTLANMLLYPLVGRRLTRPGDPVFLTRRLTQRWLGEAGFRVDEERTQQFGIETCWVAIRR